MVIIYMDILDGRTCFRVSLTNSNPLINGGIGFVVESGTQSTTRN